MLSNQGLYRTFIKNAVKVREAEEVNVKGGPKAEDNERQTPGSSKPEPIAPNEHQNANSQDGDREDHRHAS